MILLDGPPWRPVVVYRGGKAYIDRQSLSRLSGRSVHTIRFRCPVAFHEQGKALYDMEECAELLRDIPTRRRAQAA